MFDTHITQRRTEYVPYEKTVHEHRAPTDQSIAILNEMEEKARQNIIKTIEVKDNFLSAIIVMFHDDYPMQNIVYNIRFKLNGKECFLEGTINFKEWAQENAQASSLHFEDYVTEYLKQFLIKKYSIEIAQELVKHSNGIFK